MKNQNQIISLLVDYAISAIDSDSFCEQVGIEKSDLALEIILDFDKEWNSIPVNLDGATIEQNATLDEIEQKYSIKILNLLNK